MKKKILALCLVIVLAVTAVTGVTLAYFTDADSANNTFTVGDVNIELKEAGDVTLNGTSQAQKKNENGEQEEWKLIEKGYIDEKGNEIKDGDDYGYTYKDLVPGNVITKKPTITNIGENSAYVRAIVTIKGKAADINKALDVVYEIDDGNDATDEKVTTQKKYDEVFQGWGINYNPRSGYNGYTYDDARGIIDDLTKLPQGSGDFLKVDFVKAAIHSEPRILFGRTNWFKSEAEQNANGYTVDTALTNGYYTKDMQTGDIRYVYYIALDKDESVTLFNGLNVPTDFDSKRDVSKSNDAFVANLPEDKKVVDQMAMFNGLEIDIEVDAIQQEGFDGVVDEGVTGVIIPDDLTEAQKKAYEAFAALEAAHPIGFNDNVVTTEKITTP